MLVFAKEKLVLLALPKTGTTAIEEALSARADMALRNPAILKHTPAYRYIRYLEPYLGKCGVSDLEVVCTVRHPIGWLGSWYRYRQRSAVDGKPQSTKGVSFDDFVNDYAKGDPTSWSHVGDPKKFVRDNEGELAVDHMFQYEQLDKLVDFLEERLDFKISLEKHNVSPVGDMTLSRQTENKLMRKRPELYSDWEAARRS
ncbi:hypothetical protein SAMN05444287_0988 [Octadecabacter temperatus]|uniref:Uncharacterized protein n=1 Tax=Octadecabacter temperatus TaxID=1458307 RepID=A0A0K0Y4M6_9RHOB|nr:hypothetical protein [Octadecabacter temperatus]AKS45885.1 hypothetical protein OSB_13320 [Octadecabacter temperatus]SIO02763.1 hypothetical protein SAMN05444287_0988 [Octadecabacter temperatus]